MNRYLSLACSLVAFFYLSSCESYSEPTEKAHQSDQPIVLTSPSIPKKAEHVTKFFWTEKTSAPT